MEKRWVVIRDYVGSYGFRVLKGDSITPGDTATPEVWAEIRKQTDAGNLVPQGEGEEITLLNPEQMMKDKQHQQQENNDVQ